MEVAILKLETEFSAREETQAILSDAETMQRLAESDAEIARGEIVTSEELSAVMARWGYRS
jgi:antitoxin YefM